MRKLNTQRFIPLHTCFATHLLIIVLSASCENEEKTVNVSTPVILTTHRAIALEGKINDTIYLYCAYQDKGAHVLKYVDGLPTCDNSVRVSDIRGNVNTRLPGTYYLDYHADDTTGNPLSAVTRTVHVVVNKAGFLNGNYNVTCTCTSVIGGQPDSTIATDNYTATVSTGSTNNEFELIMLKVGPEYVVPNTSLNGNSINVGYYSRAYAHGSASGTLSATKNTFTIESTTCWFYPKVTYLCKNVYSKQLIINDAAYK